MIFRTSTQRRRRSSPATTATAPTEGPQADQRSDDRAADADKSTTTKSSASERLDDAVAGLGPFLQEAFIPTSAVINPLLVVWDAAHDIDPYVSSPVEHLLTALVTRTWVTPAELTRTLGEVRSAAAQACLLLDALASV